MININKDEKHIDLNGVIIPLDETFKTWAKTLPEYPKKQESNPKNYRFNLFLEQLSSMSENQATIIVNKFISYLTLKQEQSQQIQRNMWDTGRMYLDGSRGMRN